MQIKNDLPSSLLPTDRALDRPTDHCIGVLPSDRSRRRPQWSTAHAMGKLVIAHPANNAGLNVALEAGVDVLAHTTPDGKEPWDEALVGKLRSAHVTLMPTLKLWKFALEREGDDRGIHRDRFATVGRILAIRRRNPVWH